MTLYPHIIDHHGPCAAPCGLAFAQAYFSENWGFRHTPIRKLTAVPREYERLDTIWGAKRFIYRLDDALQVQMATPEGELSLPIEEELRELNRKKHSHSSSMDAILADAAFRLALGKETASAWPAHTITTVGSLLCRHLREDQPDDWVKEFSTVVRTFDELRGYVSNPPHPRTS